ncbi:MAG TPA: UDP-N-acetylmuramoyl-L-alanine--D-glutamate ligase, partial [Candidatus Binatia bacterium]|nr:UDP-N-acetylmuramoyl-L-alanine--D-glutamate ligase [Candidatus Binatia bacterium]
MELAGKKILVIGLARTGRECARFLAQRGARVWVSDRRAAADLKTEIKSLEGLGIDYRLGG